MMDVLDYAQDIITLESSTTKYICTLCKPINCIVSTHKNDLEIHIRNSHPEATDIRCIYCSQFVSSSSISKHIELHFSSSGTQPYLCPICPKGCDTLKSLAQHCLNTHEINPNNVFFKCGHCDEAMNSPSELKAHLSKTALLMYHCCYPDCTVITGSQDLLSEHLVRYHGVDSPLCISTLTFMCSWPSSARPINDCLRDTGHSSKHSLKSSACFLCTQCYFGTIHLETFAQHISCCRSTNYSTHMTSLSVNCVLYRCSQCCWTTNVRNMLIEHLQDTHPLIPEHEGISTEDFTVPLSDECVTESYNFLTNAIANLPNPANLPQISNFSSTITSSFLNSSDKLTLDAGIPPLGSNSSDLATCHSVLSRAIDGRLTNINEPHSIDSCEVDEVGDVDEPTGQESDDSMAYKDSSKDFEPNSKSLIIPNAHLPGDTNLTTETKVDSNNQSTTEEFVQLYFNEQAFINAYMKCGKFGSTNKVAQHMELSSVLEKLRRFASYRVPILGRANQRRVAGCPECLKPFNHGFTDLKKHLLVTHLGVRRDISRFTIDFTHSSRNQYNSTFHRPIDPRSNLSTGQSKSLLNIRNGRLAAKTFRKKPLPPLSLSTPLIKRPTSTKSDSNDKSPSDSLEQSSFDGLPMLIAGGNSSYSGSAPVHRVIPGTGISDHGEDMCSLEEVAANAPTGRGGIVPLDEMGNPIVAAVMAANQPHASSLAGGTEIFLPKFGRQRIQLAYSLPVFKRLLEAYQVPMPERIQLVNRMNHYARMHVIMDVLVPGGAQKRFSCPTCMYTSVHSLADIRKHIMGSHCGISTKRFRLCLRASRHDTTTYRLHSDDRMIRFVEDHRRRQLQLTDSHSNLTTASMDSDSEDNKVKSNDPGIQIKQDESQSNYSNDYLILPNPLNDQEELETQTIETDQYEDGHLDETLGADAECDNRFLTANNNNSNNNNNNNSNNNHNKQSSAPDQFVNSNKLIDHSPIVSNTTLSTQPDEMQRNNNNSNNNITGNSNEEFHRRIELPFSHNVLRLLLERENMAEQYDDLVQKMQVYSKHYLTVVSRGNRIYAYICICGRRFAVVRDEVESDIRPASLADCRRHILGVHARIPQELLTLCCQASRISKESGYKLYADNSLLALAEQHKFRSSRVQSYTRRLEGNISPSSKRSSDNLPPIESKDVLNDKLLNSLTTTGPNTQSNMVYSHSAPSQVAMRHSSSYSTNHPLPPMLRAPVVKHESNDQDFSSPNESNEVNGQPQSNAFSHPSDPPIDNNNNNKYELPVMKKFTDNDQYGDRIAGLDLQVPLRILTSEEAAMWSQKLNLPEAWTLERIVRLVYSPVVFDHQVRTILPDGDSFIASLHERMKVYARHSVYITRSRDTPNPAQRIYVCCACLTTSHHGFGDVRKHILGVHAHVPERFKSAAMSSSRLNRDDYSLYTDNQLLQLANTPWRGSANSKTGQSPRSARRRQRFQILPEQPRNILDSPSRKRRYSGNEMSTLDFSSVSIDKPAVMDSTFPINSGTNNEEEDEEDNNLDDAQLNGHFSFPSPNPNQPIISDPYAEYRPPIILTLSRPKAFHPSDQPDELIYQSPSDLEKSNDDLVGNDLSCSSGSRSRRSMILKSKRPCPTST